MYYILCKRTLFFSFTYEIEKEKAKKKTVVSKEQMIELVSMYFIDRKRKREREKGTDEKKTEQTSLIHSFREKSQDAKEEKNLSFFFARNFLGHFLPFFSLSSSMASFLSSWPIALLDKDINTPKVHT